MGLRIKQISFIYLISYLAVAAVGFGFLPKLTMELFFSNGDYGDIMPRMVGVIMGLLSFVLFSIYRLGDWKKYSPITIAARTPAVIFIFWVYYLSKDPMFLVINGIVLLGLTATIVGTLIGSREEVPA